MRVGQIPTIGISVSTGNIDFSFFPYNFKFQRKETGRNRRDSQVFIWPTPSMPTMAMAGPGSCQELGTQSQISTCMAGACELQPYPVASRGAHSRKLEVGAELDSGTSVSPTLSTIRS